MGIAIERSALKTLKEARRALWAFLEHIERREPFDEETYEWTEQLACYLDEYIDGMERK